MKRDWWNKPFKKMVTLGESHTVGASATQQQFAWPFVLKQLIDTCQAEPVALVNRGLGADFLSPSCPNYKHFQGQRPIGMERYRRHLIDEQPDLAVISYGYNDLRGGTPLDAFRADMQTMISDIRSQTACVLLLLDTYHIPAGGFDNEPAAPDQGAAWSAGDLETQHAYNRAIRDLAQLNEALFASAYEAMGGADWTVCAPSGKGDIHANDLGHRLVAHCIFQELATHCSGLSVKALAERQRVGKSPWRRGENCSEARIIADFYPDSPVLDQWTGTAR